MRRLTALLLVVAALAAGCGTKGSLYLSAERDAADLKQKR